MGKSKVIINGFFWTVVNNAVYIVFGFISVPILIKYFGKDTYGLIGLAGSINVYLHLLDMGMTDTNVRFFSEYIAKKQKDKTQKLLSFTFLFYLLIGIINSIVLFVVSFYVGVFFKVTPDQALILQHLVLILALNATFSWVSACLDQYLRAHDLMGWLKIRGTILRLSIFIFLGITIVFKLPIEFYYFFNVFSITFILPLSAIKAKKISPEIKIRPGFDKATCSTVLPYALTIFSFSIFQFLAFNFRPLLLGNMIGPESVADFHIVQTITLIVTLFSGALIPVLLPVVTKMKVTNDDLGVSKMMMTGTKYVVILLTLIIFAIVLVNKELLTIYVGQEYVGLSKWLVLWLMTLLLNHRSVMTSLVFTEKKLKEIAVMGFFAMCAAFAVYFVCVPIFGVGGVVMGFTAHEVIHTLFYYLYFLPKRFHIDTRAVFTHSVLPVWVVLAVVLFLSIFIGQFIGTSALLSAIVKCVLFICIAIPSIWFIVLNNEDRLFVKSKLNFRKK